MCFRVFCCFIVFARGQLLVQFCSGEFSDRPLMIGKRLERNHQRLCWPLDDMALPMMVAPAARNAAIASLSELLGDRLSTGELVRQQHGRDASYHPCVAPDAVAFAQSTEEVSAIVRICARHKVPIIPFGSGSGLEGNVVALRGGVSIDLSRMNRILRVSPGDLDATV